MLTKLTCASHIDAQMTWRECCIFKTCTKRGLLMVNCVYRKLSDIMRMKSPEIHIQSTLNYLG
jgi:hypothetical protein